MATDYTVGDRTAAFPAQPPESTDYNDFRTGTELLFTARSGSTQNYAVDSTPTGSNLAYFVGSS